MQFCSLSIEAVFKYIISSWYTHHGIKASGGLKVFFFKYLLIGDMLSNFHFSFVNVDFLWNFGNVHLIAPELLLRHSKDAEEYYSHLVWPDIFSVLHGWIHFSKRLFCFDLDNLWNLMTAQPKCLFCCWMNFLTRCISKQN